MKKPVTTAVLGLALSISALAQFQYDIRNGTITITRYTGPGGDVTIPDTINGRAVTAIGSSTFFVGGVVEGVGP